MKPILYFAHWCPDTEPFVAELERLGVEFDECDITKGGSTLKPFLRLRDQHPAFNNAKANGYIHSGVTVGRGESGVGFRRARRDFWLTSGES